MISHTTMKRVLFCLFTFSFIAAFAFLAARHVDQSGAYTSGFQAGNIISDATMRDYNSLSESDIQAFLKANNSCHDTNLSKSNHNVGYTSEAYPPISWHVSGGHYVCMADDTFSGGTAAHIIYRAAQDYHINPKVLIVLLQKEQSLITDTYPNSLQYRSATGYGCPDTAACDSKYYGLNNQIRHAAAMFDTVLNGGWTNYPLGWNYIKYNPNSACGGSNVYIENLATSALYRYTPYQPGGGSGCAAYGNINFYSFYTDWFGSTQQTSFNPYSLDNSYIPNGTYNIVATNGKTALNVQNAGTANSTNIQISAYNNSTSQQFKITRTSDGFYTITNVISGKAIDVSGASLLPGANVQLYENNGTCAQKWAISYDEKNHYVFRNTCSGNALDITSAYVSVSGTNVQSYTANQTVAQEWDLVARTNPTVSDGTYSILSKSGLALDISGASRVNGSNVQIYPRNYTAAQTFTITRNQDGFYTIKNPNANRVVDVSGASRINGSNIQLWDGNSTCAQKWSITTHDNGTYNIRNACSGKSLDITNGHISNSSTNVWLYDNNSTDAQQWILTQHTAKDLSGTYYLRTDSGLSLDISGASTADGANAQIYTSNQTKAQTFRLQKTSDGFYTIINPHSNKALDVSGASTANGANIQLWTKNGTCAQKWFLLPLGNGYSIRNACSGKVLDIKNGYISRSSTNVWLYEHNATPAQKWLLTAVK